MQVTYWFDNDTNKFGCLHVSRLIRRLNSGMILGLCQLLKSLVNGVPIGIPIL